MSNGETIKIRGVPDDTKSYLVDYKKRHGLNWKGMALKLEELLRESEDEAFRNNTGDDIGN